MSRSRTYEEREMFVHILCQEECEGGGGGGLYVLAKCCGALNKQTHVDQIWSFSWHSMAVGPRLCESPHCD